MMEPEARVSKGAQNFADFRHNGAGAEQGRVPMDIAGSILVFVTFLDTTTARHDDATARKLGLLMTKPNNLCCNDVN